MKAVVGLVGAVLIASCSKPVEQVAARCELDMMKHFPERTGLDDLGRMQRWLSQSEFVEACMGAEGLKQDKPLKKQCEQPVFGEIEVRPDCWHR